MISILFATILITKYHYANTDNNKSKSISNVMELLSQDSVCYFFHIVEDNGELPVHFLSCC